MSKKDIEAVLARGVDLLDRFLPLKSWIYFPVLNAVCVWAVRRVFDYRERILAWQVWLDPEFVRTKPDEFVLDFFHGHAALRREYAAELDRGDLRVLRAAFPALYSVVGLGDAFLQALFKTELEAADYRPDQGPGRPRAVHPSRSMRRRRPGFAARAVALALVLVFSVSCLTHLARAKRHYAAAQELARASQAGQAVAHMKRALEEAVRECRRRPSSQSFTVRGLAEASLSRWREAEASFLQAFALGFTDGEAWASDSALAGLAASFEGLGLETPALRIWAQLADKSDFKPALLVAAERRTNLVLARAVALDPDEKSRTLAALLKTLDRLLDRDFACGLYHYLHAQVDGHIGDLRRSYEESVMAHELGLPSEKIGRDNDNQLVYCYVRLCASLLPADRDALAAAQARWAAKWGWRDDRTPAWKKE